MNFHGVVIYFHNPSGNQGKINSTVQALSLVLCTVRIRCRMCPPRLPCWFHFPRELTHVTARAAAHFPMAPLPPPLHVMVARPAQVTQVTQVPITLVHEPLHCVPSPPPPSCHGGTRDISDTRPQPNRPIYGTPIRSHCGNQIFTPGLPWVCPNVLIWIVLRSYICIT